MGLADISRMTTILLSFMFVEEVKATQFIQGYLIIVKRSSKSGPHLSP